MFKNSANPVQEGLKTLQCFVDYGPNELDSRNEISKVIVELSYSPTSYSYETVLKYLLDYHLIFVGISYIYLFHDLWKEKANVTRLHFDNL